MPGTLCNAAHFRASSLNTDVKLNMKCMRISNFGLAPCINLNICVGAKLILCIDMCWAFSNAFWSTPVGGRGGSWGRGTGRKKVKAENNHEQRGIQRKRWERRLVFLRPALCLLLFSGTQSFPSISRYHWHYLVFLGPRQLELYTLGKGGSSTLLLINSWKEGSNFKRLLGFYKWFILLHTQAFAAPQMLSASLKW